MEEYGVVKGLSEVEISKLAECEGIIRRGIKTFVEVGNALMTIRDQRLYREQCKTFEEYCTQTWSMGRRRANQLIEAAAVVENLGTTVPKPESERHIRPLAKLPPAEQPKAWQAANEKAEKEGRKVTAKDVQEAVLDSDAANGHHRRGNEIVGQDLSASSKRRLALVAKSGNERLLAAVQRGHIPINKAAEIAMAPEDKQAELLREAVFRGRRATQDTVNRLGADTYDGGAEHYADLAIAQLRRIDPQDRNAGSGVRKVLNWMDQHFKQETVAWLESNSVTN